MTGVQTCALPILAGWWNQTEPDWARLRNETIGLLQQEDRLQQIVKLVGPDVLPDSQRLVLTVCEILKSGFLQQNAFDPVDMYSTPTKQMALLKSMMKFYDRGRQVISMGGTLAEVRELPIRMELIRAKSTIANDDVDGLRGLEQRLDEQFAALERQHA